MNRKIVSSILIFLVVFTLIPAVSVLAIGSGPDPDGDGNPSSGGGTSSSGGGAGGGVTAWTLTGILEGVLSATWKIAATIVIILWIVTGLLFLQAQGAPDKLTKAKTSLMWSIAGTIIVILAWSAVGLVSSIVESTGTNP